jgi:hypothetical protein
LVFFLIPNIHRASRDPGTLVTSADRIDVRRSLD